MELLSWTLRKLQWGIFTVSDAKPTWPMFECLVCSLCSFILVFLPRVSNFYSDKVLHNHTGRIGFASVRRRAMVATRKCGVVELDAAKAAMGDFHGVRRKANLADDDLLNTIPKVKLHELIVGRPRCLPVGLNLFHHIRILSGCRKCRCLPSRLRIRIVFTSG